MEPFAYPEDLEAGWRSLTDEETGQAEVLLGRASRMVRGRVPGVDDRITAGTLDAELVGDVVCSMVKRAMVGEVGVTSATETVGPYSQSRQFANPAGDLYLSKAELQSLTAGAASAGRAFSISTLPAPWPPC